MNQVVLIGRLTRDPDLRFAAGSGKAVCKFGIAVNRIFDKDNADFFNVTAFGKTGESAANHLAKGRLVAIQGRIQNNNYETQSGEKRYFTEIIAINVQYLERANKNEGNSDGNSSYQGFHPVDEDDPSIPF